ncbi:class I SAM-dependent methyltransferase [Prosthecobacter sp.]|uniref:class I SAM-dependent methyltransferase n=1 Tax=Prosthecobacter sp. TaxID=1965333 RepID=UPI0037832416
MSSSNMSNKLDLTPATCPVCSNSVSAGFSVEGVGTFHQCGKCGFIFVPETKSEDANLYDETFGSTNIHPTYRKTANGYMIKNEEKLKALLKRFQPWHKTGRILDIGCSAAFFMHLAQKNGWQADGVEIAPWAAEFSNKELGVRVFCGMLEQAAFPDNTFDVAFSSHVLEHISDPKSLLLEMKRVLRPGGLHVSVVPTQFASPSWRLQKRFIGDPPPKHVSFFDKSSFTRLVEDVGMEVVSVEYNVELTRLYELTLDREAMKKRWQDKLAVAQQASPARPQRLPGWAKAFAKSGVNFVGNALGAGDELLCLAVKK